MWKGIVDVSQERPRAHRPETDPLEAAHHKHRHLCGERVLCMDDGQPVTDKSLRRWPTEAKRTAQLPLSPGALHVLRHTFCSHLSMRAAPAKAQGLAGHENLMTTLRYMHPSPVARVSAIGLQLNPEDGVRKG